MRRLGTSVVWGAVCTVCALSFGCASGALRDQVTPDLHTEGELSQASIHGMQVVVRKLPDAESVVAFLFVQTTSLDAEPGREGLLHFAAQLARYFGTSEYGRNELPQRLKEVRGELWVSANDDFLVWASRSEAATWREVMSLLSENFLRPNLPGFVTGAAVDLLEPFVQTRRHFVARTLAHYESADRRIRLLSRALVYRGTPYAVPSWGTPESLETARVRHASGALEKVREANRLLLVVVGPVTPREVVDEAARWFSQVPDGHSEPPVVEPLRFDRPALSVEERDIPTVYVRSAFPLPRLGDPEFAVGLVALRLLHNRLYDEIRTKRGLSYAPEAFAEWHASLPIGVIAFSSTEPNVGFGLVRGEIARLSQTAPDASELEACKATLLTHTYLAQESLEGQADALANAQLLGGDVRWVERLPALVRAVPAEAVRDFTKNRMKNLQTAILGDLAKVDRKLFEEP